MSAGSSKGEGGLVSKLGYEGCNPDPWYPMALEMWISAQHSLTQGGKLSSFQNRMSVNSPNHRVKDVGSVSVLLEEPGFTPVFVGSEGCWLPVSRVVSRLYMCHWKDVFILGSCEMTVMVKTLKVTFWEYVGMHAFMPTYTCTQT